MKEPFWERMSWVAGIVSAVAALFFGWQQMSASTADGHNIAGNQAPVVVTQGSSGTTVVINMPPPHQRSDQDNCSEGERWVGMTPSKVQWLGTVPLSQAHKAVFHGELRWTPEIQGERNSTYGIVRLEVDGQRHTIYEWSSPNTAVFEFDVPIAQYLKGTSGKYRIEWAYTNGKSGICIVRSEIAV